MQTKDLKTTSMHSNWRDCAAWKAFGTPWTTTSNEACKMFDASLTQYVGWYDDSNVGGIVESLQKTLQADPNFVMGHVIKNGLELLGTATTTRLNAQLGRDIYDMAIIADKQTSLTSAERQHVHAVRLWSEGQMAAACNVWETILMNNPLDLLASKFAHDTYFYLGYSAPMRDSLGRTMPYWKPDMPLYGYLCGMYSFGLEETNKYDEAEKIAKKGLEINPRDAWSTHSVAHVLEMTGRQDEGIRFMSETERNWSTCGMLSCHNYWHWALHMIEKGDYDGAKGIYDNHVFKSAKASSMPLDIVDACSLLKRMEFEDVNIGAEWKDLMEVVRPHIEDHVLTFNDNHILLACLGAKDNQIVNQMMDSIKTFIQTARGDQVDITKEVGLPICEAFVAYDEGDYARAVDILYPLRYKVISIGGSHAQRDLYNLFLIQAAFKSKKPDHRKLARFLLMERKSNKLSSPMTDRLMLRAMALHAQE